MYQIPLGLLAALTEQHRKQIVVAIIKGAVASAFAVLTHVAKKEYDRARRPPAKQES